MTFLKGLSSHTYNFCVPEDKEPLDLLASQDILSADEKFCFHRIWSNNVTFWLYFNKNFSTRWYQHIKYNFNKNLKWYLGWATYTPLENANQKNGENIPLF